MSAKWKAWKKRNAGWVSASALAPVFIIFGMPAIFFVGIAVSGLYGGFGMILVLAAVIAVMVIVRVIDKLLENL